LVNANKPRPYNYFQYRREGFPRVINLNPTLRCNLFCDMCQAPSSKSVEAPPDKMLSFLDRLGAWLPDPLMFIITGGEPLLSKHTLDYIERIAKVGHIPVLNTNGVLLTVERIKRLIDAGLEVVNISLDGVGELHDRLRNGPGLYAGILDILYYLTHYTSLNVNVVMVIHALNAHSLPELAGVLRYQLPGLGGMQYQAVVPTLAGGWNKDFFELSPLWPRTQRERDVVLATIDHLIALKRDGAKIYNPYSQFHMWQRYFTDPHRLGASYPCLAMHNMLQVTVDGKIQLCERHGAIGTIDDDPAVVWNGERAQRVRAAMHDCAATCNYKLNCCYFADEDQAVCELSGRS